MRVVSRPIRVLIAQTSLDGHWRGMAVVASALRDAGMEVIFGGQLTAGEILRAILEEDVDVVGLHIGGRYGSVKRLLDMLQRQELQHVLVIAGGTIPPEDIPGRSCSEGENVVPARIAAAKACTTLGEMCGAFVAV